MDCIFCKIINGDLPSKKLYEDDQVIAIMDAFPTVEGHVLIIPKIHYSDFTELPQEVSIHIQNVATKLTHQLIEKLKSHSMTFSVNYGTAQIVKHYHQHLLPNLHDHKIPEKSVDEIFATITK